MSPNTLSIIIPSYNEEKTILILLDKIFGVNLINEINKEIIIDDGSCDNTITKVNDYIQKKTEKNIKLLVHADVVSHRIKMGHYRQCLELLS